MQKWSSYLISAESKIIEAMAKIDENALKIVFVQGCDGVVLAALTDGDVRRHIISGKSLDAPVIEAANKDFFYVTTDEEYGDARRICVEKSLSALPRLDGHKRLAEIYFKDEACPAAKPQLGVPVVIMAGGKGTRLYPYTKVLPKPLVPIGDITITEHIMDAFAQYGCDDVTMIVNYRKNMIKAYFSDNATNRNVKFVDETEPLGTGGGLKLLEGAVSGTFFMTNCDVLVFADYGNILKYHGESGNIITMVCATKTVTIPYGTVEVGDDGRILSLAEKPSFSFLTNTGFYVIEPEFLGHIIPGAFMHITDIVQSCIAAGEKVGIFPVNEGQWADMGQHEEMEKMLRIMGHAKEECQ
jgi:dTDP-glucose pyrophosphorylase